MTVLIPPETRASAASASAGIDVDGLVALARDPSPSARQRLLLGVVNLCDVHPPGEALSPVLAEIFLTLARQAERDIRRVLAFRLSGADWPPRALISLLATDEIEIARPVLAASPVLQDDDLLRVMVEATLEHQIAVARRPNLTRRVADAIIETADPAVLTALASNPSAAIAGEGVTRLVEHSRRIAALRSPLSRHPALTEDLALQMYQWVGVALRQSINARFSLPDRPLAAGIEAAVMEASRRAGVESLRTESDDESDRRLIAKLEQAGQLKPSYLVRAVRERRLGLFTHALAALSEETVDDIRQALNAPSAEALYYVCATVGIDRAVFPAMLSEIRNLNDARPGEDGAKVWRRGAIDVVTARRGFRVALASMSH